MPAVFNSKYWRYACFLSLLLLTGCNGPERTEAVQPSIFPVRWADSIGMEFALIPAGKFSMYLDGGIYPEAGAFPVTLSKSFYIGRSLVTKGMLKLYQAEVGGHDPELGLEPEARDRGWDKAEFPLSPDFSKYTFGPGTEYQADGVTWTIANDFCRWLSKKEGRTYRLPTEAEWEYAINGGSAHWPWFSGMRGSRGNWGYYAEYAEMCPFYGLFYPDCEPANPYGIYPPGQEWVQDRYANLSIKPVTDPTGPSMLTADENKRVVRLGGLGRGSAQSSDHYGGFRVVCVIDDHFGHLAPIPARQAPAERPIRKLTSLDVECGPGCSLKMLKVPAGTFMMGRPKPEYGWGTKEWPQTQVTIPHDYWLGCCAVTQAQFRAVTGLSPSWFKGDDHPAECVIYSEILKFVSALTQRERETGRLPKDEEYRLPTEAEWEYACRAGTDTLYSFGDDPADLPFYEVVDVADGTHPVATKRPNPWGFYDMEGNVLELTCELFGPYPGKPSVDPFKRGTSWNGYLFWVAARGGAWCMGPNASRTTFRRGINFNSRCHFIGFRLARGQIVPPLSLHY